MAKIAKRLLLALVVLLGGTAAGWAEEKCSWGFSGDSAYDAMMAHLTDAKSCKEAARLFNDCRWGSSADTQFAPQVIALCEKSYLSDLSALEMAHYGNEMQLCAYRYAMQQGTMYMSAAASCQVEVALKFSRSSHAANKPLAKASFDCAKAQSYLEKAICADNKLGQADIVLGEVYKDAQCSGCSFTHDALAADQKQWLASLNSLCKLDEAQQPVAKSALICLRHAFELRFTALDTCSEADGVPCLAATMAELQQNYPLAARASFDCDVPETALEIAICADADLGQTDVKLADAYQLALARTDEASKKQLVDSERHWLAFVAEQCPLGAVGGIPPVMGRACVKAGFEQRIAQLQECQSKPETDRPTCLNAFRLLPENQN